MFIKILCFGKLDSKPFQEMFDYYGSKISKKVNFEVIELKEQFQAEPQVNLETNSKLLMEKLAVYNEYEKVVLDVNAKIIDSIQFSQIIENNKNFNSAKIIFVVGPSDGFSQELVSKYSTISFGKITYPHQLFRVVLVEQIYRALKIIDHEKYHK